MKHTLLTASAVLFLTVLSTAQILFVSSTDTIAARQNGFVAALDTVFNEGTIDLGDTTYLYVLGDHFQNETTSGNGHVSMGGTAQTITGGIIDNLDNDNTTTTLTGDVAVNDTLKLNSGHVVLDVNTLTLGSAIKIENYSASNFIVTNSTGVVTINTLTAEKVFPVGIAVGDYTPAAIANSGTADNFSVRVQTGIFDGGLSGNAVTNGVERTWDVSEAVSGGSNVTLKLQYNTSTEGADFVTTDAFVSHYTGTVGNNGGDTVSNTKWDLMAAAGRTAGVTGNLTDGSSSVAGSKMHTRSGFTTFSPFSIGSYSDGGPLPVELIEKKAVWSANDAVVTWTTASEVNNDYFRLERSFDGNHFENIATVYSRSDNGFSNSKIRYSHTDEAVRSQTVDYVYYRLTQFDFDGANETFDDMPLRNSNELITDVVVYPNPAKENINYELRGASRGEVVNISLINALGVEVYNEAIELSSTNAVGSINVSALSDGPYHMVLESKTGKVSRTFIIQ